MFLMAERLRNLGKFTFADIASYRLDQTRIRTFAAFGSLTVVCFYLIVQMVGAGQLIQLLFGLEYNVAVVLVGVLMMVYVTFGGMVATTWVQIIKAILLLGGGTTLMLLAFSQFGFSFETLVDRARQLSRREFHPPPDVVPGFLKSLSYDQFRDIRFRPERSLWRGAGLRFEVQFFHPGFLYTEPVRVYVVDEEKVSEVPFHPALFDYGKNLSPGPVPERLGFAGFRVHHPLHRDDYFDEVAVFLGATAQASATSLVARVSIS